MAKSGKSRFAIMGMLALAPRSSGYDIKKMMEGSTQYFWKETYSSIYPVLGALIEEGLVSQHEDEAAGERQRKAYALTAAGQKALEEWMRQPVEVEQFRNELLLKLFFGELAPPSATRRHIAEFQRELQSKYNSYQAIREELQAAHQGAAGLPFWLMTLDYGIGQVKAALEWCEAALRQYDQLEGTVAQ